MHKWICDKCGKEFKEKFRKDGGNNLWELRYNQWITPIAEVCDKCRVELDELINAFFGQIVVEMEES